VHLDELIDKLLALRELIAEGEQEELEESLSQAVEARQSWIKKREKGDWEADTVDRADVGGTGLFGNLFGFTDRRRRRDN
ncbi:MAG: hypothetical protein R3191_00725, partial [Anaerolineales bacterium]|nr:hypothetical protein [Anaerolineales bacterium]